MRGGRRTDGLDPVVAAVGKAVGVRPQIIFYTVFGDHLVDAGLAVAASSLIDVTRRIGIGEHATRATLARMTRRGSLARSTRGRRAFFALTERGRRTVLEGRARAHDPVVPTGWDGRWTLVAFSLPDDRGRERYGLRVRLGWAGFGNVQGGLWICPREVDVDPLLAGLDAQGRFRAFSASVLPPTSLERMVAEAYPLAELAAGYHAFERRWASAVDDDGPVDALARRALLAADWSQVVRQDPRLPAELLPQDWPAAGAQSLFHHLVSTLAPASREQAATDLDVLAPPDPPS